MFIFHEKCQSSGQVRMQNLPCNTPFFGVLASPWTILTTEKRKFAFSWEMKSVSGHLKKGRRNRQNNCYCCRLSLQHPELLARMHGWSTCARLRRSMTPGRPCLSGDLLKVSPTTRPRSTARVYQNINAVVVGSLGLNRFHWKIDKVAGRVTNRSSVWAWPPNTFLPARKGEHTLLSKTFLS